jgi:signal transduction histidine kinase
MDTPLPSTASSPPLTRELLRASWRSWYSNDLRLVGPRWLQWVWTLVFSAVVAVGFTIVGFAVHGGGDGAWRNVSGWAYWYGLNLVVSCCVGFTIHALYDLGAWALGIERIRSLRGWRRALYQAGVPIAGLLVGWPLGLWIVSHEVPWLLPSMNANSLAASLLVALLIAVGFSQHFITKANQILAEQRATEAQLKLLQGQMEPHFLFNTLANVLALMEHDVPKARQTLESLTEYLRSSLAQLRRDEAPLAAELELVENYLKLLKTRMEDRLEYRIEADATARAQPLPPLLLQPLVENAVHHGLEPQVQGGTVRIAARVEGRLLHLDVSDDGAGPEAPARRAGKAGNGVALANLRQRLLARYGSEAALDVSATSPGTRVRMTLPLDAVVTG